MIARTEYLFVVNFIRIALAVEFILPESEILYPVLWNTLSQYDNIVIDDIFTNHLCKSCFHQFQMTVVVLTWNFYRLPVDWMGWKLLWKIFEAIPPTISPFWRTLPQQPHVCRTNYSTRFSVKRQKAAPMKRIKGFLGGRVKWVELIKIVLASVSVIPSLLVLL